MRRWSAVIVLMCGAVVLHCGSGLPDEDAVIEQISQKAFIEQKSECGPFEIAANVSEDHTLRYLLTTTCPVLIAQDESVPTEILFGATYLRFTGDWELNKLERVPMGTEEDFLKIPPRLESFELRGAWVVGYMMPVFGALGLFLIVAFLLRNRKSHRLKRTDGPGLNVKHKRSRPGQRRSHWTINSD